MCHAHANHFKPFGNNGKQKDKNVVNQQLCHFLLWIEACLVSLNGKQNSFLQACFDAPFQADLIDWLVAVLHQRAWISSALKLNF